MVFLNVVSFKSRIAAFARYWAAFGFPWTHNEGLAGPSRSSAKLALGCCTCDSPPSLTYTTFETVARLLMMSSTSR